MKPIVIVPNQDVKNIKKDNSIGKLLTIFFIPLIFEIIAITLFFIIGNFDTLAYDRSQFVIMSIVSIFPILLCSGIIVSRLINKLEFTRLDRLIKFLCKFSGITSIALISIIFLFIILNDGGGLLGILVLGFGKAVLFVLLIHTLLIAVSAFFTLKMGKRISNIIPFKPVILTTILIVVFIVIASIFINNYKDYVYSYEQDMNTNTSLDSLSSNVELYVKRFNHLPTLISQINNDSSSYLNYISLDQSKYTYRNLDEYSYEECATFIKDISAYSSELMQAYPGYPLPSTTNSGAILFKFHKGLNCFNITLPDATRFYVNIKH